MTLDSNISSISPELLKRFIPLNTLPVKHLKEISKYSRLLELPAKSLLFKRNVDIKERYYLVMGEVDLCDAHFDVKRVQASFSEPATNTLNATNPTTTAAVAISHVTLLAVNSDHLDLVLTWSQAGDYLVEDLHENNQENDDWMSDLLQSNLLQKIPPSHIQQLFMSFQQENFRKGQKVITQGDVGENFYVLQQGSAQVLRTDKSGEEHVLATLAAGRFFGEEALISDSPRNASVKMLTDGACMKLDKATFNKLLKEPVLNTVSAKAVIAMQLENPKIRIVDLRTVEEAQSDPLENVLHIPFGDLRQRLETLDQGLTYIAHSINGRRAELGAYLLNDAGFEALVMK